MGHSEGRFSRILRVTFDHSWDPPLEDPPRIVIYGPYFWSFMDPIFGPPEDPLPRTPLLVHFMDLADLGFSHRDFCTFFEFRGVVRRSLLTDYGHYGLLSDH